MARPSARDVQCEIQREQASWAEVCDFGALLGFLFSAAAVALVRIRRLSAPVVPHPPAFRIPARFRVFAGRDRQMRRGEMAFQFLSPRWADAPPRHSFPERARTSAAPARARSARFLEVVRKVPRWIDIENEKLGIEIGSQLLGFGERTGDCAEMLGARIFFSAELIVAASASYSSRRRMLRCGISARADLRRTGTWQDLKISRV